MEVSRQTTRREVNEAFKLAAQYDVLTAVVWEAARRRTLYGSWKPIGSSACPARDSVLLYNVQHEA